MEPQALVSFLSRPPVGLDSATESAAEPSQVSMGWSGAYGGIGGSRQTRVGVGSMAPAPSRRWSVPTAGLWNPGAQLTRFVATP